MPRSHKVLGLGQTIDNRNPSKKLKAVMDHKGAKQRTEDMAPKQRGRRR